MNENEDTSDGMMKVTKTELVWPGKYSDDGTLREVPRISLPFQVIETINESRATRETAKRETPSLFDYYEGTEGDSLEEGWHSKLIWGDNAMVMPSLLEKGRIPDSWLMRTPRLGRSWRGRRAFSIGRLCSMNEAVA